MTNRELSELRAAIEHIDRQIVELAAERTRLGARLGEIKQATGSGIRDFSREKEVVDRARAVARGAGLSEALAENLMLELIQSSLTVQEQGRVRSSASGTGRSALVIGGEGLMGRWFVRFLESQGFEVAVADPRSTVTDWRAADLTADLVVIAAPLPATAEILHEMASDPPPGLIFDVGSLKTPLREGLGELAASGANVTSIHPMFGADTELLSGRHVVLVDVGVAEATAAAGELFASTMVTLVEMDLDAHDRLIAYILGLSHALNIAFFTALSQSGETADRLADLSSTTFDRQLAVASQVAAENPHLYFEIQYLNEYGGESLAALAAAVERLRELIDVGDAEGFATLMRQGESYLRRRRMG
jgi:chorismate mutase/prephenate dehydrogenase